MVPPPAGKGTVRGLAPEHGNRFIRKAFHCAPIHWRSDLLRGKKIHKELSSVVGCKDGIIRRFNGDSSLNRGELV
jgi:hypothetical protein